MNILFRPAIMDDALMVLDWRNHPRARAYSRNKDIILKAEHLKWWMSAIHDPDRTLLIASDEYVSIGVLRLDYDREIREIEVSLYINPELYYRGYGTRILKEMATLNLPDYKIVASILPDNVCSQKAFLKAGFIPTHQWVKK